MDPAGPNSGEWNPFRDSKSMRHFDCSADDTSPIACGNKAHWKRARSVVRRSALQHVNTLVAPNIADSAVMSPITEIAARLDLSADELELRGRFKAKLPLDRIDLTRAAQAKLILVSAMTPTPAGEGKTTSAIGIADGLSLLGHRVAVVLREPSLGPVFGMKGGATGGGRARVVPHADINLHFNGDFAAIEKAHNLLAALVDNQLQNKKNSVGLDPLTVRWKRVCDMNDRALRRIVVGLGGRSGGVPRETGFDITAASEIMAILCFAQSRHDLRERLGRIFIGFTRDKQPVFARDLKAHGAMAALLKDAILPNLVQTLEGTPRSFTAARSATSRKAPIRFSARDSA